MRNPFRPRNWLYETWKQEMLRRIEALEASVAEAHLRLNVQNNDLNFVAGNVADLNSKTEELELSIDAETERVNRMEGT
jgi:hypothetical protein